MSKNFKNKKKIFFRRIYIGGKSFIIDEDGNEIPDSEVSPATTSMKAATAEANSKAATAEANKKVPNCWHICCSQKTRLEIITHLS